MEKETDHIQIIELLKSSGVGHILLVELFHKSKIEGIKKMHLLTTTANRYFERYGFKISVRSNAPEQISQSKEFLEICRASSIYMTLKIKEKQCYGNELFRFVDFLHRFQRY